MGIDSFCPDPGEKESMSCLACGEECRVERNVNGARSWAGAMGGSSVKHDSFRCPHIGKAWHDKIVELFRAIEDTPSKRIASLIVMDINDILGEHAAEIAKPKFRMFQMREETEEEED